MKLCADILYWRLKEELTGVLFHGRKNSTLILNRPEFYLDRSPVSYTHLTLPTILLV